MILRWLISAVFELLLSLVAVLLSPVLALFARTSYGNPYCSAPGPREYLPGWLQLFSTHDDGIDALWFKGMYDDRAPAGWPEKARAGSWSAKYVLRVLWIVRNSAYGFAHYTLGFDRTGGYSSTFLSQRGKWDTDKTNWLVRVDTNAQGRKAFQVRGQFFFSETRYLRVNLGWKLDWVADRVQIATHLNPFRTWEKSAETLPQSDS